MYILNAGDGIVPERFNAFLLSKYTEVHSQLSGKANDYPAELRNL